MPKPILEKIEQQQFKTDLPNVSVGDTVDVHVRIIEGEKQRIQVFTGVVISIKGSGLNAAITVRRIVANEGVERVFPLHSPKVSKIEIVRHAHVRRSKLYYLRQRIGKSRRLRDRRRGLYRQTVAVEPAGPAEASADVAATDDPQAQAQSDDAAEAITRNQTPVQAEAGREE